MSTIFSFFYIYDPWLFHFLRMALVVGIIAFFITLYQSLRQKEFTLFIPTDSLKMIILLILLSTIPALIYRTNDFSIPIMYIKALILFILGTTIYHLFYHSPQGKLQLIRDIKIGIIIQFFIGLFALMNLDFIIDFSLSTNIVLPRFYGSEQEYRLYNITSSAFFQLSLFYLFLLHFLLAYNEKNNSIHSIYLFFMLCIGLISGRTFLLLSIVSILCYFKWRYIPSLALFCILCLILAITIPEHKYIAHALEPIINLIYGKGITSSSTDTLMQKHLFIPEIKQILFGDGYYYDPKGGYYGGTDSGFLRQILYGGISYLFICFCFTAYFIKRIADNWFNSSWKFILSTLLLFTILNIKADTYAFPGIMLILLMFLSLFGKKGHYKIYTKSKGVELNV